MLPVQGLAATERLLTPGEVATLFRVNPKTVSRWAAAGRITAIKTPGGHRRRPLRAPPRAGKSIAIYSCAPID